jgi:hypothetical protein
MSYINGNFTLGSYLRCPACGSSFQDTPELLRGRGGACAYIRCVEHGHGFELANYVPDLLPPRYVDLLKSVGNDVPCKAKSSDIDIATDWLASELSLPLDASNVSNDNRTLRELLYRVATLVRMKGQSKCSDADIREVYSILTAEAMSEGYRQHIADPVVASEEAVNYEKYEDILLRRAMESCLANNDDVALIELGSGPGRVLHQYGSVVSNRPGACKKYRAMGAELYSPESLENRDRIRLILGIDFAHDMLQSAAQWFQQDLLDDLVRDGRISQVCAAVSEVPVNFDLPAWQGTSRVACILFQTLGQQIGREAQLEMLNAARRLIGERGIVFVSVFNAEAFEREGLAYYESVRGSVGEPWCRGDRSFISERGVYSKWFWPDELRSLFDEADMQEAVVLDTKELPTFSNYRYIDAATQEKYKRRVLIGVFARGVDFSLS